jgi:hypothetical protein
MPDNNTRLTNEEVAKNYAFINGMFGSVFGFFIH